LFIEEESSGTAFLENVWIRDPLYILIKC